MQKVVGALAMVAATALFAGCAAEDHHGHYHPRGAERRERDTAWEVVKSDPCRYREYEDYARDHKSPDKRRAFAEHLARDGCSHPNRDRHEYRYDDPYYEPYRR